MTPEERIKHLRTLSNVRNARYRAAHPERLRASSKKRRDATKAARNAYNVAYRATHQESVRAYRQKRSEATREYMKTYIPSHKKRRRAYYAAAQMRRQAIKRQAMPVWADQAVISALYREAERLTRETGVKYEVDHIYPLRGETVSGLHCEANLRVVTRSVNRSKSNRHPDEAVA